jgi:1-deoxy-D-xylulose-5-phosphate synthase
MRFVKPLDEELINEIADSHDLIVTVEDNAIAGGAGSGVNEFIATQKHQIQLLNIGLPDSFIKHGSQSEIYQELGLDAQGLINQINHFLNRK